MHQARNERFYVRGCHRQNETEAKCRHGAFYLADFIFACSRVGNGSGRQYGSEKSCGEGVLAKKIFLTFCRQLRCEILEISLYTLMFWEEGRIGGGKRINKASLLKNQL